MSTIIVPKSIYENYGFFFVSGYPDKPDQKTGNFSVIPGTKQMMIIITGAGGSGAGGNPACEGGSGSAGGTDIFIINNPDPVYNYSIGGSPAGGAGCISPINPGPDNAAVGEDTTQGNFVKKLDGTSVASGTLRGLGGAVGSGTTPGLNGQVAPFYYRNAPLVPAPDGTRPGVSFWSKTQPTPPPFGTSPISDGANGVNFGDGGGGGQSHGGNVPDYGGKGGRGKEGCLLVLFFSTQKFVPQ